MPFDKNIDMEAAAKCCIDAGEVGEGYTLVLLQQIRDELRETNAILRLTTNSFKGAVRVHEVP